MKLGTQELIIILIVVIIIFKRPKRMLKTVQRR